MPQAHPNAGSQEESNNILIRKDKNILIFRNNQIPPIDDKMRKNRLR